MGYPEWWDERQRARAQAKFAAANIAETGQRQNAQIAQREGSIGDGNNTEINAGGGGSNSSGGGGEVPVRNFVERAGAGEATKWGGGGFSGGNGFGLTPKPNNTFNFQFTPPSLVKFRQKPHVRFKPPDLLKYDKSPTKVDNSSLAPKNDVIVTKNRFAPLINFPLHLMCKMVIE